MLDLDRLYRGMEQINVGGVCNSEVRHKALEDAIAAIQQSPNTALKKEYIGVKQYAHFGDQRCDCTVGMGPTHGSIVFRITRLSDKPLDGDAIYLLEASRDFGLITTGRKLGSDRKEALDLCGALRRKRELQKELDTLDVALEAATTDTHELTDRIISTGEVLE